MRHHSRLAGLAACLVAGLSFIAAGDLTSTRAKRDHLTPLEVEQVRAAQILDKRIEVFIKAVERRFTVITGVNAAVTTKQAQKDLETWGELPKGTRAELLTDIAKILDEAITNIDDVAARDANNRLLPKALRKLAAASTNFVNQLTPLRAQAKDEIEREALEQAMENAQSIIAAANKLPPDTKEKGKTEKSKS